MRTSKGVIEIKKGLLRKIEKNLQGNTEHAKQVCDGYLSAMKFITQKDLYAEFLKWEVEKLEKEILKGGVKKWTTASM